MARKHSPIAHIWPMIRWGKDWDPHEEQMYSRWNDGYASVAWSGHASMSYWFYGAYMSFSRNPLEELMNG